MKQHRYLVALALMLSLCQPALASNTTATPLERNVLTLAQANFPFNDVQQLTPEQVKIQKYKLERLRINQLRDDWSIIRGINEKIDDMTLLKLMGQHEKIEAHDFRQTVGNGVALGGLALAAGGGLMMTDLLKFQNSFLVGLGLVIVGGAVALGAELWAGNVGEESLHLMERPEAEKLVKEYNEKLKKDLGLEHLINLE